MDYLEALKKSPVGQAVRECNKGSYKIKVTMFSVKDGEVEVWISGRRIVRKAEPRDVDGFRDFYAKVDG